MMEMKIFSVLFLSMISLLAVDGSLVGGWHNTEPNDEYLKEAAEFATNVLSDRQNSMYHKKLDSIISAQKQIVSGLKLKMNLKIVSTNCRKNEMPRDELDSCDVNPNVPTFYYYPNIN